MAPSPIQMPTGSFASEIANGQHAAGTSAATSAGGQPMSLPQSPGGRSSFLPSFMRRPRAATGESLNSPPTFYFDRQQPSQPISSESLVGSNGPSSPGLGAGSTRRQQQQQRMGGLPSPPLSTSHREDPLVNFGQRLMRRISNQGGGSSGNGVGGLPTIASSGAASGGISPSRSAGGGVTPAARSTSTPPTMVARPQVAGGASDESRASVAPQNGNVAGASSSTVGNAEASSSTSAPVHRLRLVPLLEASNSLPFDPVVRDVPETFDPTLPGAPADQPAHSLRIGRFTDKQSGVDGVPRGGAHTSNKVAFKSKVVSRIHAELWVLEGGRFFVRDTKSSSGTFLNHQRLSPPGQESRPFAIKDGDILQLGVDYQGGTEEIYKCVKMRAEIGRGWQTGANNFNTAALKQLQALGGGAPESPAASKGKKVVKASTADCCICLFSVTICQSLFIAPCSHVFHYKCIRPLLEQHHPGFSCPVCRSFADLEADVETEEAFDMASRRESLISRRGSLKSVKAAFDQGLAEALGVGPEPPRTDSDDDDDDQVAREPVVWDGGLTPGVTPGLALVSGHTFGSFAAAGSVPPIPELESLSMGRPLVGSEDFGAGMSPAESVRAAARGELDLPGPPTGGAAAATAQNPSSASLTDVGGPSSPSAMPVQGVSKPADSSDEAQSGANTSSTSPDAVKDAPLVGLGQGAASSSSAADQTSQ